MSGWVSEGKLMGPPTRLSKVGWNSPSIIKLLEKHVSANLNMTMREIRL